MAITDPISNLLTRIKNGTKAHLPFVSFQSSRLTTAILELLKNEGYISNYEVRKNIKTNKQWTIVQLKYKDNVSAITGMRQISKPGLRVYQEASKLPRVLNGLGIAIISTNLGVITDKTARKQNVGGEIIAYVW